jgi:serine/threonine protein kinase
MPHPHDRPILPEGTRITRFAIKKLVGQGGYGDVYSAVEVATNAICAIKIEYLDAAHHGLQDEIHILRQLHGSEHFPRLIERGRCGTFAYCAMPLLGPSLSRMRRVLPGERYSVATAARLALAMLACLEALHATGHIHRDVKPGNFLVRASRQFPVCLIDFGLSRSFRDRHTGFHYQYLPRAGFIGTARYASLHAHKEKRLSRRDDLVSWFYSVVEMAAGRLPWPAHADKGATMAAKKGIAAAELCAGLPAQFAEIWRIVRPMKFADRPNYAALRRLLRDVAAAAPARAFDWEALPPEELARVSPIALDMGPPRDDSEGDAAPACAPACAVA